MLDRNCSFLRLRSGGSLTRRSLGLRRLVLGSSRKRRRLRPASAGVLKKARLISSLERRSLAPKSSSEKRYVMRVDVIHAQLSNGYRSRISLSYDVLRNHFGTHFHIIGIPGRYSFENSPKTLGSGRSWKVCFICSSD